MSTRSVEITDRVTIASVELADLPWPEFKRRLRQVEAELVRSARGAAVRVAIKRRVAEEVVIGGLQHEVDRKEFLSAANRSRTLGYSSIDRRVLMACVFAQWANADGRARGQALRLLGDARRRVQSLRRISILRRNLLAVLSQNEQRLTE